MTHSHRVAALACLVAPCGCNTLTRGTTQTVTVLTVPDGASCTVERIGAPSGTVSPTPGTLEVQRASDDIAVACTKDGYRPARVTKSAMTTRTLNAMGSPIIAVGGLVDLSSGADYSYPPRITVQLDPAPTASKPRR